MRQQIEHDKEMMSKKFEKLSRSKNVLPGGLPLNFVTWSSHPFLIDESGALQGTRSIIHDIQLKFEIEEFQAQAQSQEACREESASLAQSQ